MYTNYGNNYSRHCLQSELVYGSEFYDGQQCCTRKLYCLRICDSYS